MTRRRDHTRNAIPLPSVKRLRELLRYDEETGLLYWRVGRGPRRVGAVAGCPNAGRLLVRVDGVLYLASRLAWKLYTGREPRGIIDHYDQNSSNNRFWNLRDITQRENVLNQDALRRNNTSGFRGVFSSGKRWRAAIMSRGKLIRLGTYKTPEQAAAAYDMASLIHHTSRWFPFGGDFR